MSDLIADPDSDLLVKVGIQGEDLEYSLSFITNTEDASETIIDNFYDSSIVQKDSSSSWKTWTIITPLGANYTFELLQSSSSFAEININVVSKKEGTDGGIAKVRITKDNTSIILNLDVSVKNTANTTYHLDGFIDGTLSDNLADASTSLMLSGKEFNYYSIADGASLTYVRNPNCWLANFNFAGVAVWTDIFGPTGSTANRGALVTSQHFIAASHYSVYYPTFGNAVGFVVGSTIKFANPNGTVHSRTVIGRSLGHSDLCLVTLNAPLPAGIDPFPLVGEWILQDYTEPNDVSCSFYSGGISFYLNQFYNCYANIIGGLYPNQKNSSYLFHTTGGVKVLNQFTFLSDNTLAERFPSKYQQYSSFFREAIPGDSGSPSFVLTPSGPALICTWWYSTAAPFVGMEGLMNLLIQEADQNAIDLGHLVAPTGLTPTIAPSPI